MKLQHQLLGQVFLTDNRYIEKIIDSLDIKGKNVLEIGPGKAALTNHLARYADILYCVEFDRNFYDKLKRGFSDKKNITIINKDILNFDIASLSKNDLIVVGNIPYQISSSVIKYLITNRGCIEKVYLTYQKEFTDKLVAKPGDKKFCFLTCLIQYYAKARKIFDIPRSAFSPIPKVDSCFLELIFYKQPPLLVNDEEFLFELIKKAFSNRRKKLINALGLSENRNLPGTINYQARPQEISLEQYVAIANSLN